MVYLLRERIPRRPESKIAFSRPLSSRMRRSDDTVLRVYSGRPAVNMVSLGADCTAFSDVELPGAVWAKDA